MDCYHNGNVAGLSECGYRAMPRVEQTLASYLSPDAASSLKAPVLHSKPLCTTSALLGKGYTAAGQAGRAVVKSTFVESKTSPSPKRFESESRPSSKWFESESRPSPKRFESKSSPSPNETVKTEKEKNLLQNHIFNY